MPEKLNLKVGPVIKPKAAMMTFDGFLQWLDQKNYSEDIKQRLIAKARTYPVGALSHFMNNIQSHLEF